jgi:hypothetical protein
MRVRTLAAPLGLALATAAFVVPASSGAAASCTAGTKTIAGRPSHTFCGPARAAVVAGSKTFRFTGGACTRSTALFTVNIGTLAISKTANAKPGKLPYFGVVITPGDSGVHLSQAVSWISGGKRYSVLSNRVTLAASLKKGTFKGTLLPGGGKVEGTFNC